MTGKLKRFFNKVLTDTAQQLQLCCHREIGNLPLDLLRRHDPRWSDPR